MTGEANDAASACAQVKMSDASRLLKLLDTECTTVWIRRPPNRRPKHWRNINEPTGPIRTQSVCPSIGRTGKAEKSGRGLVARRFGKKTQLGMSLC